MSLVKSDYFKKYLFIIGGALSILPIGLYYLYRYLNKRKSNINVVDDTISLDISKEIKESSQSKEKKQSEHNLHVDSAMANDIKPNISEKTIQNILKTISENVLNTIIMTYDVLREDYDRATEKFKAEKVTLQDLNANKFKAASKYKYKF